MCGRLAQTTAAEKAAQILEVTLSLELAPRYNVAPSQPLAVLRQPQPQFNQWALLRWGLIPHWAKAPDSGYKMINAKAETLASKPAFRNAYRYRRCVIPADGFYEWQKQGARKQPYYIHLDGDTPMLFAGLWERWQQGGRVIESVTIITTEANDLLRPLHHRMPVILPPEACARWLDAQQRTPEVLQPVLRPYPSRDMTLYKVDCRINNPTHDDPRCVAPLAQLL